MKLNFSITTIILSIYIQITNSSYGLSSPHPIKIILNKHMGSHPAELFKLWHYLHKREYNIQSIEGLKRYENFKKNLNLVTSHNSKENNKYKIGLNDFADMTLDEYKQKYLIGNQILFKNLNPYKNDDINATQQKINSFWDLPEEEDEAYFELFLSNKKTLSSIRFKNAIEFESVNWIDKALLNDKVYDQGTCGSCWAFAATQAVEAAYAIKTAKSITLSKQQLIDCESQSSGCNGGTPQTALDYMIKNGCETEFDYPYVMADGKCNHNKNLNLPIKIISYEFCTDESKCSDYTLFHALSKGPVAAVVDASEEFMLYEEGIYDKPCISANHAILVVGYHKTQENNEESYWIVKNSWGETWGDHGYIKIKHNANYNSCLLKTYYLRPDLE